MDDRRRIDRTPGGAGPGEQRAGDGPGDKSAGDGSGEKEKSGLRPAQLAAGGIAATTAAFLCSFFGVYGTVIGTGLISVLSTVGSEFYLRSARKSKEAARKAKVKASELASTKTGRTAVLPVTGAGPQRTLRPEGPGRTEGTVRPEGPGRAERPEGPDLPTQRMSYADQPTVYLNADQPTDYLGVPAAADTSGGDSARGSRLRRRWPILAATSAVVFAIGLFLVTGFELATGQSLSGQGRSTVSEIVGNTGQESGTDRGGQQGGSGEGDGGSGDGSGGSDGSDGSVDGERRDVETGGSDDGAPATTTRPAPADGTDGEQDGRPARRRPRRTPHRRSNRPRPNPRRTPNPRPSRPRKSSRGPYGRVERDYGALGSSQGRAARRVLAAAVGSSRR
ncbi:hypothetical protein BJF85_14005 [Saccharomonospora sp. CUA-673]|nr:hypothetical protein [Saccharomonospora sp. CUA-673]OLT47993.1 hypothetical protein BJF85_14005 [Saccharomonospora sp. CUA-673]